jgi:hypothetical protein
VCVNREILLKIDLLIPRVVKLLDVRVAPAWLCPEDGPVVDTWDDLHTGGRTGPDRAVLVTAEQLPPGLARTAIAMPVCVRKSLNFHANREDFAPVSCSVHEKTFVFAEFFFRGSEISPFQQKQCEKQVWKYPCICPQFVALQFQEQISVRFAGRE